MKLALVAAFVSRRFPRLTRNSGGALNHEKSASENHVKCAACARLECRVRRLHQVANRPLVCWHRQPTPHFLLSRLAHFDEVLAWLAHFESRHKALAAHSFLVPSHRLSLHIRFESRRETGSGSPFRVAANLIQRIIQLPFPPPNAEFRRRVAAN